MTYTTYTTYMTYMTYNTYMTNISKYLYNRYKPYNRSIIIKSSALSAPLREIIIFPFAFFAFFA